MPFLRLPARQTSQPGDADDDGIVQGGGVLGRVGQGERGSDGDQQRNLRGQPAPARPHAQPGGEGEQHEGHRVVGGECPEKLGGAEPGEERGGEVRRAPTEQAPCHAMQERGSTSMKHSDSRRAAVRPPRALAMAPSGG